LFIAPITARLSKKIYSKNIILFGIFLNLLGIYFLQKQLNVNTTVSDLTLPMIFFGAGIGMVLAQISNLTLSAVSNNQSGEASGIVNTVRTLGQALGSAIIGTIFVSALSINISTNLDNNQVIGQQTKQYLSKQIENNISDFQYGGIYQQLNGTITKDESTEIKNIIDKSIVLSNQKALVYNFGITVIALVAAFFLPKIKIK
jgi:hypothetical protein